jgi:hypothetical protein
VRNVEIDIVIEDSARYRGCIQQPNRSHGMSAAKHGLFS